FAVGMSIFATNISSEHFIGLAGAGASRGMAVGQFELMAIFVLIFLGWVAAPIYIKSSVLTTPEFLEKRFGSLVRGPVAVLSIVLYIFTKMIITFFAGGLLFNRLFGVNIYTSAIIIVLLTGLYSTFGGATAVIKTGIFQGVVLILSGLLLTVFGLKEVGGFARLQHELPTDFFHMFKPVTDRDYPWTGILFGAPIIAFWYWITDQYFIQKILSAKDQKTARTGSLFAASLKVLPVFILVLPGLIAAAVFHGSGGDQTYPMLVEGIAFPAGVRGLILAGVLAAIMSSLAGIFNTSALLVANDIYLPRHRQATDHELVLVGRLATLIMVMVAIMSVSLVKLVSNQLYLFLQALQGYVSPPIAAIFLFAFVLKKGSEKAALWTLIIGEATGLFMLVMKLFAPIENVGIVPRFVLTMNFLHLSVALFLFSIFIFVSLSYVLDRKSCLQLRTSWKTPRLVQVFSLLRSSMGKYRMSILFSFFIFLIVVGLWKVFF
ncbi:MAG: sodium:solute symporter family transporter, partial [Candidatus Kryptoniota bacterium]